MDRSEKKNVCDLIGKRWVARIHFNSVPIPPLYKYIKIQFLCVWVVNLRKYYDMFCNHFYFVMTPFFLIAKKKKKCRILVGLRADSFSLSTHTEKRRHRMMSDFVSEVGNRNTCTVKRILLLHFRIANTMIECLGGVFVYSSGVHYDIHQSRGRPSR